MIHQQMIHTEICHRFSLLSYVMEICVTSQASIFRTAYIIPRLLVCRQRVNSMHAWL